MACNSTDLTSLRIGDNTVERTDNFRYLGSVLDASGDIDRDINHDPKMPVKLKGQVYRDYSEAWPVLE
ncbi:unnamed protein product [Parnassius apollo]|uniref:(apollo) hypothetical protein n=1 Tax=Parnassius apollo TaxID=110799 RepID=A0A8S3XM60_PARAO|nr:unnamed protein product [Parnassius apollo]